MSKIEDWYKKRMKEMGYKGCANCKYQIEPLRGCEWLERGGDGRLHIICPKWERRIDDDRNATCGHYIPVGGNGKSFKSDID